uniref:Uncharacterized protein n=1 Tax=Panagrolaimus sp. JU765 TaxID=591449 RepID=A0AC34QV25_9BILA
MKNLWLDAMEFLEGFYFVLENEFFDLNMEIVSKLNHLKYCIIHNHLPSEKLLKFVDKFPKLPILSFSGQIDDELLKLLASKSNKSSPLRKLELVPRIGFSIYGVEHFLKRATFVHLPHICLKMNAALSEVEKMFKRINKYKVISFRKKGEIVVAMLKKIDEKNHIIVVTILLYL